MLDALHYSLHLSDTKTRTRPTLPPEEDAFAGRIQLMLYHRLLSNALSASQPDIASSQPLDFDAFWRKAGVDPTRRFSDSFLLQAGLPNARRAPREGETLENPATDLSSINCLNDLTRAWHREVEALNAVRVDNTLTIIYRAQPTRAGQSAAPTTANVKGKEKERENEAGASESIVSSTRSTLSEREARDIAAAIQASLRDLQLDAGGDGDFARAMSESLGNATRSGQAQGRGQEGLGAVAGASAGWDTPARANVAADMLAEDRQLVWALEESLTGRFKETPAPSEENNGESGVAIGTLLPRAATEEPEGASKLKIAPSSPPAARVEEYEDEDYTMITAAELETKAKIIGTKEFALDDGLLDNYLKGVLAWWYGERPPQGVDVNLTGRCVYVAFYVRGL